MRFAAIANGEAELGMIPIENSIAGRVADIHHLLPTSGLHIIGEHFLPIHFQLMAPKGATLEDHQDRSRATSTRSASAASIIRKLGCKPVVAADTAGSARADRRGRRHRRAPRSRRGSRPKIYGLEILAENVEDEAHNTTRFVVLSRETEARRAGQRPGRHDLRVPRAQRAGRALQGARRLRHQRRQHDQARELHDRGQFFATQFYADVEGHPDDAALALALEELAFFSQRADDPRRLSGAPVPRDVQGREGVTAPALRLKRGEAMAKKGRKVRRTLHLRFTLPSADPSQLLALVNASKPFYEMLGGTEVRLIQNVDDPGKFIQTIEYETPEEMEINRARIAGDMRMQGF